MSTFNVMVKFIVYCGCQVSYFVRNISSADPNRRSHISQPIAFSEKKMQTKRHIFVYFIVTTIKS